MSVGTYSRGRPVYGSGSYAPNRGHVSPQGALGYMQREMRRPNSPYQSISRTGRDGQSDTRSGVAANILARKGKDGKKGKKDLKHGGSEPKHPFQNEGRPVTGQPGQPQVPVIQINENGTLDLPFDDEWSQALIDSLQTMNTQLLDLSRESQSGALEYLKANRELDSGYESAKRSTLNQNAAAGTAFSSAYGNAVSENARDYNLVKNDLLTGNAQFMSGIDQSRLQIQNAFNEMLRRDILNRAKAESLDEDNEAPNTDPLPKRNSKRSNKRRNKNRKGGRK
jgi:hypothetical protein